MVSIHHLWQNCKTLLLVWLESGKPLCKSMLREPYTVSHILCLVVPNFNSFSWHSSVQLETETLLKWDREGKTIFRIFRLHYVKMEVRVGILEFSRLCLASAKPELAPMLMAYSSSAPESKSHLVMSLKPSIISDAPKWKWGPFGSGLEVNKPKSIQIPISLSDSDYDSSHRKPNPATLWQGTDIFKLSSFQGKL